MEANTTKTVPPDVDTILTRAEAARLLRLSTRSLERMGEVGEGPPRIQLSERRVAYWRRDLLDWLASRTTPAKAT